MTSTDFGDSLWSSFLAVDGKVFDRESFQDLVRHWEGVAAREAEAFGRRGWPPCLRLPLTVHDETVRFGLDDSVSDEEFDERLLTILDERFFDHCLEYWRTTDVLSRRLPILEEVIAAMKAELWSVAVPTLIAQTEGLIVDALALNQHFNAARDLPRLMPDDLFRAAFRDQLHEVQSTHSSRADEKYPYRNPILHGLRTDYGSRKNAVKTLLFFDNLVSDAQIKYQQR